MNRRDEITMAHAISSAQEPERVAGCLRAASQRVAGRVLETPVL